MIDDLERFKTIDTGFGYRPTKAAHIIDSIHFVKSNNNHLIQLADIVSYVLLRGKRVKEELSKVYKDAELTVDFDIWVDQNASQRQKIELKHFSLLAFRPFLVKEFP